MSNIKKTLWTALYALGALTVAILLFLAAAGPQIVLFPDAMLPMDLRELASAWLGIGFLPMLLVSVQVYKGFRKRALFIPSGICLLSLLFWVGVWTVGMLGSPALTSSGDIVLPEPSKIEAVRLTGSELDVTIEDEDFITQLLQSLSQAKNTGKASIQDVPDQGAGLVRIDFAFRPEGTSTVFLYREDDALLLEQPYQGIYQLGGDLELWLREQIAYALAESRLGG